MIFERREQAVVSSRVIAEHFGKRHKDILESIRNLVAENSAVKKMFQRSFYESRGRKYPESLMNRDGFSLLVMGFTGKEALGWKVEFINVFNHMEKLIRERQSTEWLMTRNQGKLVRRSETDTIANLVVYAKAHGSANADKMYIIYSKLVNSLVGIEPKQREKAHFKIIMVIMMLEDMILNTVDEEIVRGTHYKDIYKLCKANGEQMMKFAYLPENKQIA